MRKLIAGTDELARGRRLLEPPRDGGRAREPLGVEEIEGAARPADGTVRRDGALKSI